MKELLEIFDLVIENKLWPDRKPSQVLTILMFLNSKGWIYTPKIDGKIMAAICAYRIKEVTDENLEKIPLKEEGNILYSLFCIALDNKNQYRIIRESMNLYLSENPDITELVLRDMDSNIKRYNLKGASNGQARHRADSSSHANVSN